MGFYVEFPLYLQRVAGQLGPLSDEAKIDLLDKSLPPAGHSFIQIHQEAALRGTEPPSGTRMFGHGPTAITGVWRIKGPSGQSSRP